jgi:cobalt-zinc-cadmium efflux system membrane fusion protein
LRASISHLAVLAAAALTLAACSGKTDDEAQAQATPQLVTLTAAQKQHIGLTTVGGAAYHKAIEATAVVDFDNDQATSVIAAMSGPVTKILVQPGQAVAAGQVLATVASGDYATAVGAYQKAAKTADTLRKVADADRDLAQHNGVSAREAEQAQTDAQNAEADRDSALKALVALNVSPQAIREIREGRSAPRMEGEIRAPLAGTVVERLVTPGQLLQAGTTAAFTIANLSKVWVQAQIPASELSAVRVGDPVTIETGASPATVDGVVDNISQQVNPDTRAVLVRVATPNPGGVLKKQMYVRVHIRSRQANQALLVPVAAVLRDDVNLPYVYVAEAGGGFGRRRVTLGDRTGDSYAIPEGLAAGDRVVTDGGLFLQFMQTQ